jgi:hypothetical protein
VNEHGEDEIARRTPDGWRQADTQDGKEALLSETAIGQTAEIETAVCAQGGRRTGLQIAWGDPKQGEIRPPAD